MTALIRCVFSNGVWLLFFLIVGGCNSLAVNFFPQSEFRDLEDYQAGLPERFSSYLAAAEEPILFDNTAVDFAVRLMVIPSYGPTEILTLSTSKDGYAHLRRIEISLAANPKRAKPPSRTISAIPLQKIDSLIAAIERHNFWTATNKQELIGSDGANWVLEVKNLGRYHVVYRWEPFEGPVFDIGTALRGIAKSVE